MELRRIGDVIWEVGRDENRAMNVPVRVLADETLVEAIRRDESLEQLVNVATLPGIARFAIGMPDMHEGYGFPVGGVAGTLLPNGVVSPGGIGFDINCGVRLLATRLRREDLPDQEPLVHELSRAIPVGYGRSGRLALERVELERVLAEGCPWLVRERGLGCAEDLDVIESGGAIEGADPSKVSDRAKERGHDQLGTLGGGNHFIEVEVVAKIFDDVAARALGLFQGQITVLIHTGSRGLGHQVCTDFVRTMEASLARHRIVLPDRQLACAPLSSPEGRDYLAAMSAAANFAFCNRQLLTQRVRETFERVVGRGTGARVSIVYDVAHNIAKIERYGDCALCVHRKGATRALGPSSADVPARYRAVGQPVFVPGSMGTASFVMVGTDAAKDISLSSSCHGAGRALSRTAAKRRVDGGALRRELEARGIVVRCPTASELAEEAPIAYKDVERVVDVVARANVARKVARLEPIGVVKG